MSAVCSDEWSLASNCDNDLKMLKELVIKGWPADKDVPESLKAFSNVSDELCIIDNKLMRGCRAIPPRDLRDKLINLAHEGHVGRNLTKARVREWYWWPTMDRQIEDVVNDFWECANSDKSKKTRSTPLSPVDVPSEPWSKLALDIAGPFELFSHNERYVVLLVDYTSKWVVTKCVPNVNTRTVIEFLSEEFSREGVPDHLVTDNGVQFVSHEMNMFLKNLSIVHFKTALYSPQANGLAESMNKVVKSCAQRALQTKSSLKSVL